MEAVLILNTAVFFHDHFAGRYEFDVKALNLKVEGDTIERLLTYLQNSVRP